MFMLFLEAAGQVAVIALVLGAGLPTLFALGVRSFAVAGGAAAEDRSGRSTPALPSGLLRAIGVLCFAVVVAAVLVGLTIIVATGLGQEVSFEHVIPTFTPKD
ncbi:hypothetical protein [Plantibacter sp. MMLR14_011]|uniref:hypothetical protein n=1 Tax=Plantibacter sp. MMLR14_011 TaxID=1898746 RepID=UPI0008DCF3E9|nr:hypothetical protein [Plantibacter sp. MMLR14_011]OII39239.1 hypothetical protein BIU99_07580 [Plantibacter sp. MMLR14_011]